LPIHVFSIRMLSESGGAGRTRGAPGQEIVYGPIGNPLTIVIPCDGQFASPRGVHGGQDGIAGATYLIQSDGSERKLPNVVTLVVEPGQKIRGHDGSGGGYGSPLHRDPDRVLFDVIEGWESVKRAEQVYGVVVTEQSGVQLIDESKTSALRALRAKQEG